MITMTQDIVRTNMAHSGAQDGEAPRGQAFDPRTQPELFDGLRTKRLFAFFIDTIAIILLTCVAAVIIFFVGIFTLGLGWLAYAFLWQGVALLYTAFTLGGPTSATPGMRAMGLEMRLWHGGRMYPLLAAVHLVLFWISVSIVTPFVLLVSLFSDRKRLLHDIILGTLVINAPETRPLA